jgi:2'-5' RNA ligase
MRCFISIDMSEDVKEEVRIIQEQLPEFNGKKTELENLHLTLKFLGEIDREKLEEVKRRLRQVKFNAFEFQIDSIGVFSESFVKIVWVHLNGVEELQKKIDNALEWTFGKEQRFMGHLTVARVKSVKDKKKFIDGLKQIKFHKLKSRVENFRLKRSTLTSNGPVYETMEEYPLI